MENFALQFSLGLIIMVGPMIAGLWIMCEASIQHDWRELHELNGWELPKDGE